MSLIKLILLLAIMTLVGFIASRVFWDGKEEESINRVMTAYIEKNKVQILENKSSDTLACNKSECLTNYDALKKANVLNEKDERFFKDGQYYIFNKNKDGKIEYSVIKNKEDVQQSKDATALLSMLIM